MTKLANKLKDALLQVGVGDNQDENEAGAPVGQDQNLQNPVVEEEHPVVEGVPNEGVEQNA